MKNPKSTIREPQEKPGQILAAKKETEKVEDVKRQIAEVITTASVQMTESVIRTVNERGSVLGLRFLWNMAGLLPKSATGEADHGALSMKTLIEKLGLQEKSSTAAAHPVGEGEVKS
jgi:hypothetical protein